ncbi:27591_t:CDS:1, partial [Gigaspora margarita]
ARHHYIKPTKAKPTKAKPIKAKPIKAKPIKACTVTDISDATITSSINCATETPTPFDCPDSLQIPYNCDKCQRTTTTTCIPTTIVCSPTPDPEDSCCGSEGFGGRNYLNVNNSQYYNEYVVTDPETCCRRCYEDSNCIYWVYSTIVDGGGDCEFYSQTAPESECQTQYGALPTPDFIYGAVGCGFCERN